MIIIINAELFESTLITYLVYTSPRSNNDKLHIIQQKYQKIETVAQHKKINHYTLIYHILKNYGG